MRLSPLILSLFVGVLFRGAAAEPTVGPALVKAGRPDDPDGRALLTAAQRTITAFHHGHRGSGNMLRVVYFYPSDRDPLPNYAERLDRVMNDISDFYRDGLRRFGIENDGLPLEKPGGRLKLHLVRGQKPASGYGADSFAETQAEIRAALHGTVDLDREHVLILHGLCQREPDGRYVIQSPYGGIVGSSQRWGLCHAADCELLDPLLLTETKKKMVRNEHANPRMEQTVAGFNSWYIGGIAHEVGHALGLHHDLGGRGEDGFGTSLMGAGNLNYREDAWGGAAPAFLSRVSALQLASHPLFTGSNRGRWDEVGAEPEKIEFSVEERTLKIQGEIRSEIPSYAAIAYVWAMHGDEHDARTYPVLVREGKFAMQLEDLPRRMSFMRLSVLYANGATRWRDCRFGFDSNGAPTLPRTFTWPWSVDVVEQAVAQRNNDARALLSDDAIASAPTLEEQQLLRTLRNVIDPPAPIPLASVRGDHAVLSDAAWLEAKVGWGQPARNHNWFDDKIQDGVLVALCGHFFDKALYAHSPSRYAFALDGKWKNFTATIGLRDGADPKMGSAIFTVRGDGRVLYRSGIIRPGTREEVNVDVAHVKRLELVTEGGEGHNHYSWSIWAEPIVRR